MRGIYGISGSAIFGIIGSISHRQIRNCWIFAVAIPRTCERDCKEILLAINRIGNNHRRIGNNFNVLPLISAW